MTTDSTTPIRRRRLRRLELVLFSTAGLALSCWWAAMMGGRIVQYQQEHALFRAATAARDERSPHARRGDPGSGATMTTGTACIGRIEIPRIGLSTMIVEGTGSLSLLGGAGHLVGSALPGEPGNVVLAAHRDTFFRSLGEVRTGDEIRIVTPERTIAYRVESITIVDPSRTDLLDRDGEPRLTLVTCYPFHWLGRAPKRYVVVAREVPERVAGTTSLRRVILTMVGRDYRPHPAG